jgi:hypothetical protein
VQKKKTHIPMGVRIAFGAMAAVAGMSSASCENPTEIIEVRPRPEFYQVFWIDPSVPEGTKGQVRLAYNELSTEYVVDLKDNYPTIEVYYNDNEIGYENMCVQNGYRIYIYGTPDDFVSDFNNCIDLIKRNLPGLKLSALGRKLDSAGGARHQFCVVSGEPDYVTYSAGVRPRGNARVPGSIFVSIRAIRG